FVGRIGRVIGRPPPIAEFDKTGAFYAVRLRFRNREDDAFADVLLRLEDDLDFVADWSGDPISDPGARSEPGGRIDGNTAIGCDGSGAKRQRRHMPFADGSEAENEAQAACRGSRLVGVRYDAGVEQRR